MTIKIHHLVAASDGKSYTELTHVYAETYEQALQEAREWHTAYAHLPILTVRAQPQGFQAGFRRLPGRVEETMRVRWRVKELLLEHGLSMKQLAEQSHVSYRTLRRLCHTPFCAGSVATRAKLAAALEISPTQITELVAVTNEVSTYSGAERPRTGRPQGSPLHVPSSLRVGETARVSLPRLHIATTGEHVEEILAVSPSSLERNKTS